MKSIFSNVKKMRIPLFYVLESIFIWLPSKQLEFMTTSRSDAILALLEKERSSWSPFREPQGLANP
jgi:hypothetical protein